MPESRKKLIRSTGIVSVMTFFSRVLGLVRDVAIARVFGAGLLTDAFFVAFKVPNLLRRFVAEGSLSTAFVPVFSSELEKSRSDAKSALNSVSSFCLLITLFFVFLGYLFSSEITAIFAPGFSNVDSKLELATDLLEIMLPYIVLVSFLALSGSALNCLGHFAWPAAAPALLNISFIILIFFVAESLEQPVFALAYAVIIGGVCALIPQLVMLNRKGFTFSFSSPFRSKAVSELVKLMLPAVYSSSVYQIMIFINTLLASMLEQGSVSWLYYADRLFQFPLGVFSLALATAVLPELSKAAAREDHTALKQYLKQALAWVSFITFPAMIGLIILAKPIVEAVYMHGSFSEYSAGQTSRALVAYSIGLWAISVQTILVRVYLAKKNTLLPSLISSAAIVLNILIAFALMGPAEVVPESGFAAFISGLQSDFSLYRLEHVGLALAGSISSFFSLIISFFLLSKIEVEVSLVDFIFSLLRPLLFSILMGIGLFLGLEYLKDLNQYLLLAILISSAAGFYLMLSLCFGSNELISILKFRKG